jgi:hypothetical protein
MSVSVPKIRANRKVEKISNSAFLFFQPALIRLAAAKTRKSWNKPNNKY